MEPLTMSARDTRSARYWAALELPPVSQPGSAIVALDAADNTLKSSTDGGAYVPLGGGGGGDVLVKATAADTTANFLRPKLTAGAGISLAVLNPGADETVEITATDAVDDQVAVTGADTTPGFLAAKIVAGANITLTVLNPGANETLEVAAAGGGASPWSGGGTGTVRLVDLGDNVVVGAAAMNGGEAFRVEGSLFFDDDPVMLFQFGGDPAGAVKWIPNQNSVDGASGRTCEFFGGQGGDAIASPGGIGGRLAHEGGTGGAGALALVGGKGGFFRAQGGFGGTDGGAGGGAGGDSEVRGGPGAGGADNGNVLVGAVNTKEVLIGALASGPNVSILVGANLPQPFMVSGPANADYLKIRTSTGDQAIQLGTEVGDPRLEWFGDGNWSLASDTGTAWAFSAPQRPTAGAVGRTWNVAGGKGGDASGAVVGGTGAQTNYTSGAGGNGSATMAGGLAGLVTQRGGAGGTDGGAGGGNGGTSQVIGGDGAVGAAGNNGALGGPMNALGGRGGNASGADNNGNGGAAALKGGAGGSGGLAGTGTGATAIVQGGASPGGAAGGTATVQGGASTGGTDGNVFLGTFSTNQVRIAMATNLLGFHGVPAVALETVTGSRGGNVALADLLTKLDTKGLIIDATVI
jgi:hypothetical protein